MDAREEFFASLFGPRKQRPPEEPKLCGRPAKTTGKPCRQRPHVQLPVACLRHMTDEEREEALRLDQEFMERWGLGPRRPLTDEEIDAIEPACWRWPLPDDLELLAAQHPFHGKGGDWCDEEIHSRSALRAWHEGRCAFCNTLAAESLVEDHDHDTGLVRGFLCRRCNSREGFTTYETAGPFAKYRERTPSIILGLQRLYRHPLTGQLARPARPAPEGDGWGKDNPLYGIGL